MTMTEATKIVRARYPQAGVSRGRYARVRPGRYVAYSIHLDPESRRLSGEHRSSLAAWVAAARKVQAEQ